MSCGNQFFRVRSFFISETGLETIGQFKECFALRADQSIPVFQVTCPKCACFPIEFCHFEILSYILSLRALFLGTAHQDRCAKQSSISMRLLRREEHPPRNDKLEIKLQPMLPSSQ